MILPGDAGLHALLHPGGMKRLGYAPSTLLRFDSASYSHNSVAAALAGGGRLGGRAHGPGREAHPRQDP